MMIPLAITSLFLASRALPYNHPTTPQAYDALRPAVASLQAAHALDDSTPSMRFLSISDILFDPGDTAELESIYGDQLSDDAFYDLIIATKHKEILTPNLPLTFGVPAVDGYDGGVLPLRNYVTLEHLLLPPDAVSMDGRLRENLKVPPEGRWLDLLNVGYLVTDKVGDVWFDGVYYDLQHPTRLSSDHPSTEVAHVPAYQATGLGIISHLTGGGALPDGAPVAQVNVGFEHEAEASFALLAGADTAEGEYDPGATAHAHPAVVQTGQDGRSIFLTVVEWDPPAAPLEISITRLASPEDPGHVLTIDGLSLVDSRGHTFQSLIVSPFRLLHSGDVKIYQNLTVLPRAFLVASAVWAPDDQAALLLMQRPDFYPGREVILIGPPERTASQAPPLDAKVKVTKYEPEEIWIEVESATSGWLVLTDAHYPGWRASVNGETVEIQRADILFRAVPIQAGIHQVRFEYRPFTVQMGLLISSVGLACCIALGLTARRGGR